MILLLSTSGQTPIKREYNYPKSLAATSPNFAIVRRFWSTHGGGPLDCSNINMDVSIEN